METSLSREPGHAYLLDTRVKEVGMPPERKATATKW